MDFRSSMLATAAIAIASLACGLVTGVICNSASAAETRAFAEQRRVVVELFTSLGCSDCPPADALLARVRAQDSSVLALDLHVTYWNDASWTDPYSLPGADELQREYAVLRHDPSVYTPEAVVDGQQSFVGSDTRAMTLAIERAKSRITTGGTVPIAIRNSPEGLHVSIGPGSGLGTVWLFGFDASRTTAVSGGENTGATIREVNVVRSIIRLGSWRGQPMELNLRAPAGNGFAVLLQRADGRIMGSESIEATATRTDFGIRR